MSEDRFMQVLIGPQHPGSGHMRFIVKMDGDIINEFEPDIGYVHRSVEKIAESKRYIQIVPLVERPTLADTANTNLGYVLALEKLLGIDAPPRAQYLRTLLAEINRIHSHLYGLGIHGIMLGSSTVFMWCFADREIWIELAQELTGARITYSYIIPGGVRRDLPDGFGGKISKAVAYMERRLKDYEKIFINNPVVTARLIGIGTIKREEAIRLGIVGPNLRASGVKYDVRKVEPYCAYPEMDFDIVVREEGDAYARVLVRVDEIKQSMRILKQIVEKIPNGPILNEAYLKMIPPRLRERAEQKGMVKIPATFINLKPRKGEAVSRVETGRGEVIYYIVSDGSTNPYRFRFVSPSLRNLIAFKYVMPGHRLADIPAIYGSLDYFPPDADR
ncbi:MAG: NADH-quinone oxidoreductase subunit D [Nitrososphaerota archaeon]|nr:NADH-quinone oxidoreductase subunit D [Nitrososphaerales archaeon]MDW8044367.1 NADH-quinone oxidoreductase subunit D [Nitrososphaerota archaeon]